MPVPRCSYSVPDQAAGGGFTRSLHHEVLTDQLYTITAMFRQVSPILLVYKGNLYTIVALLRELPGLVLHEQTG